MADYLAPVTIGGVGFLAPLSVPAYIGPPITPDPDPNPDPGTDPDPVAPVSAGTVQYIKLPTSQLKLIRITVT